MVHAIINWNSFVGGRPPCSFITSFEVAIFRIGHDRFFNSGISLSVHCGGSLQFSRQKARVSEDRSEKMYPCYFCKFCGYTFAGILL